MSLGLAELARGRRQAQKSGTGRVWPISGTCACSV